MQASLWVSGCASCQASDLASTVCVGSRPLSRRAASFGRARPHVVKRPRSGCNISPRLPSTRSRMRGGDAVLIRAARQRRPCRHSARQLGWCPDCGHCTSEDSGPQRTGCETRLRRVDLAAEVQRITGGKGHIVFDPVGRTRVDTRAGGCGEGIIIIYGGLSGKPTPYPPSRR